MWCVPTRVCFFFILSFETVLAAAVKNTLDCPGAPSVVMALG